MREHAAYTEADWQAQRATQQTAAFAFPCPDCGSSVWHKAAEPRKLLDGTELHYRMCKVCGFWQRVGGRAVRCWGTEHRCVEGVQRKALMPDEDGYDCEACGRYVGRDCEVPWPLAGSG